MKTRNKKVNEKVTKGFKPLNRAELILGAFLKDGHMPSGYFDSENNGFYDAGDNRYISYGKKRGFDERSALIRQVFENLYTFRTDTSERKFKIFSFMHVRKNYEHKITQALTVKPEHAHLYWERWCIFRDGTFFAPDLTEQVIKKIEILCDQDQRIENDYLDKFLSVSNLKERNTNVEDMDEIPF